MPRERGDNGQYQRTVAHEDVLGVFDEVWGPVVTSADVADQLDVTRETARRKLNQLVETDSLAKRKTAGRVVYWRPQGEGMTASPNAEVDMHPAQEQHQQAQTEAPDVATAIAEIDTPGSGQSRETREDALREAYTYLKTEREAKRSDFKDLLGDDVGYASFASWWSNYVKDKGALEQLPNVDPPAEGEHIWSYTGSAPSGSNVYDPTEEL